MTRYEQIQAELRLTPQTWLVTGVAGFIGSHLLETLLKLNQRVVGLDNFATGYQSNLDEVQSLVSTEEWENFYFMEGDIRKLDDCRKAMTWVSPVINSKAKLSIPVDYVLHQAALGSVPRSLADPLTTHETNNSGFLNMLISARDVNVCSFTYAASSSTYGDHPALPKVEENIGKPLSPYAVTKYVNELYANVFSSCYGFNSIGLRYFNVFGPRQDPDGAYAAVIPKWSNSMIKGENVYINGDGETSRDFCYVSNVVQANLLAATTKNKDAVNQVYNIAFGGRTTLKELFYLLKSAIQTYINSIEARPNINSSLTYREFRNGDVRHSQADISKAHRLLCYTPSHDICSGIKESVPWYVKSRM